MTFTFFGFPYDISLPIMFLHYMLYNMSYIYIYHSSLHIILYGVLVHDAPLNIEVCCGSLYDTSTTY